MTDCRHPKPKLRSGLCAILVVVLLASTATPLAVSAPFEDQVFYHFMPIAWRDSDGDPYRFGDFGGMTASLDYLEQLGVTAVWMNPIFPSPAYHGYQHGAADELNGWFGTEAEWTAFVEAAHARDIEVYVDMVAYGIGHDSLWYQDAAGNPASPYDGWLAFTDGANTEYQGCCPYPTWNGSTVGFIHWDLRAAEPRQLVTSWAQKWLDPDGDGLFDDGIDGYRLDHVWATYPFGPDGWGYHIESFWAPWRQALRSVNSDVLVFAEQADWGSHGTELLLGMDAAFTKPFEFATRHALATESALPLYQSMAATVAALEASPEPGNLLCTIGNHDVDRLATAIGDDLEKGKAAAAVLLTQPFPPVIYYGDEIGMRGAKDPGLGSDASDIPVREPFEWNAFAGPPMTAYLQLHQPAWTRRVSRDGDGRSVEEQLGSPGSLLESYRELIALRRSSVALRRGAYHPVSTSSDAVWSFVRHHPDQQVLVAINLSGAQQTISSDLGDFGRPDGSTLPTSLRDGTARTLLDWTNAEAYPLVLAPYASELLQLRVEPPSAPPARVDGRDLRGVQLALQNNVVAAHLDDLFELDRLLVRSEDDRLVVGMAGNLSSGPGGLCLFYDAVPGGQNPVDVAGISPPPTGPEQLTGLRFDDGFTPEGFFYVNNYQQRLFVDQFHLLDEGGAWKTYRGETVVGGGNGFLVGGENPSGLEVALDDGNNAGVSAVDVSGAGLVTTGLEMSIPLEDLGLAPGTTSAVRIAVFLLGYDGVVTNQWLPGLGGGASEVGVAPDLRDHPGEQHVQLSLSGGAVSAPLPPAALDLRTLAAQAEDLTRLVFTLPHGDHVELVIYDLRGRRVRTLVDGTRSAGEYRETWDGRDDAGRGVAAGVYFARLRWSGLEGTARVLRLR